MRYPPSFLDELRARLPVSEVVGRRVKLKRQGREWIGLSPFNKEKSPSFTVNDQKGFYHDFSSGKHGDIFSFIMETEGLSFAEAVEHLAQLVGLEAPKSSKEQGIREQRRASLFEVLELAAKYFESSLASQTGASTRGYLADRGISSATQVEFRLGYAPSSRFALKEHLGAHGISVNDMVEAGLLIAGDDIPVPYDRFRDRLIIPIQDQRGRVIAFAGRAFSETGPKYLNSPETALFHKGSTVFNFHRARPAAHSDGSVVVVEGYLDAISVYQAGLKSVVATMGTAFTDEQIQSLWRLSNEPIVCFDSDKAGLAAAHRSIDRILPLLKVGRTFRFAFLRGDKDPDDLVREQGIEAFKAVLRGSLALWDVLWEREVSRARIDTPDGRAALEHGLNTIIRTISDPTVNTAYFRTCRIELSEFFWKAAKSRHVKGEPGVGSRLVSRELSIPKKGRRHGIQKVLLGMLVHYPEFIEEKSDQIARVQFHLQLEEFRVALYDLLILYSDISVELIYSRLKPVFYEVLQDIHGDQMGDKPRGHRLFQRFPILMADPAPEFISECMDHFANILRVEQMGDDIHRLQEELSVPGSDTTGPSERLMLLIRDLHLQRELINNKDIELAEKAKEIRNLRRTETAGSGLLAA